MHNFLCSKGLNYEVLHTFTPHFITIPKIPNLHTAQPTQHDGAGWIKCSCTECLFNYQWTLFPPARSDYINKTPTAYTPQLKSILYEDEQLNNYEVVSQLLFFAFVGEVKLSVIKPTTEENTKTIAHINEIVKYYINEQYWQNLIKANCKNGPEEVQHHQVAASIFPLPLKIVPMETEMPPAPQPNKKLKKQTPDSPQTNPPNKFTYHQVNLHQFNPPPRTAKP